jgi:Cu/Ag efflux protein CusF
MEKSLVRFFFVTFFALATPIIGSSAQQKPATVQEKSAIPGPVCEYPIVERFFGTIEKVDEPGKTIAIKGKVKKEEKTLNVGVDDKTKITRAKTELNMANLKRGMNVLVEYKKDGDKLIAAAIKVSAPKAGAKEKTAPKGN